MNYRGLTTHYNMEDIFIPVPPRKQLNNLISNQFLLTPIWEYLKYRYPNQKIQQTVQSINDQHFFVKFRLLDKEQSVMAGDTVYPQVIVENSYEGQVRPKIGVGYVRQICTNGMLSFEQFTEVKVTQEAGEYVEQLLPIFQELEDMEIQVVDFSQLAHRRLNSSEINWVTREINQDRSFRFSRRMIRRALLTASLEADQLNSPMNAWLLYNGFNNAFNHMPFAFGNSDLQKLDGRVLAVIKKVIHPDYRPIVLPTPSTLYTQPKKIKQTSSCFNLAEV